MHDQHERLRCLTAITQRLLQRVTVASYSWYVDRNKPLCCKKGHSVNIVLRLDAPRLQADKAGTEPHCIASRCAATIESLPRLLPTLLSRSWPQQAAFVCVCDEQLSRLSVSMQITFVPCSSWPAYCSDSLELIPISRMWLHTTVQS
jgi:hypothetical protein